MHEHFLGVLVSVSGTNDALQQSVAKAKSTTHTNRGCLTRPFISILSVHLRQEYLLFVTAGLLTYPVYCAFPTMKSVAKECNKHTVAKGLTAAGTVPDSHRIPVNPSLCRGLEAVNWRQR